MVGFRGSPNSFFRADEAMSTELSNFIFQCLFTTLDYLSYSGVVLFFVQYLQKSTVAGVEAVTESHQNSITCCSSCPVYP